MRRALFIALATCLMLGLAATPSQAANEIRIISNGEGYCLTAPNNNNGGRPYLASCVIVPNTNYQKWQFAYVGTDQWRNSWYQIKNVGSGKCLVVQGTSPGAIAFQYTCLSARYIDQHWALPAATPSAGGYTPLVNRNSGQCLVENLSLVQRPCTSAPDQEWHVWY